MNYNYTVLKKIIVCVVLFCLSAGAGAFISGIFVTDEVLTPITLSFDDMRLFDTASQITYALKVPLVSLTVLFVAAFTEFAFPACISVSALRGASLGYSIAEVSNGAVRFADGAENSLFISSALYMLTSVSMLCLGYFSVTYADRTLGNRFNGRAFAKYFVIFLVLSGTAIVCEAIRIIII